MTSEQAESTASGGRLAGKVALITGTASGQGRAAALRFAREGAKVIGCDIDEAGAQETLRMVTANGGEMRSLQPLDLSDEAQVEHLIEVAQESFGGLDILYNNAGTTRPGPHSQGREDYEFTMNMEVTTVWLATKAAVKALERRGGGSVINVASVSATTGSGFVGNFPGLFAHSLAKAAVLRMTTLLAIELAPMAIRVNAICPGVIETGATAPMLGEPGSAMRRHFVDMLLVPRIGESDDVVNAAVFLASDEASYITGASLAVDGGWAASGGAGMAKAEVGEALAAAFGG